MTEPALVVDKAGLARKLANKPKAFILFELLQNALDEGVRRVTVEAEMVPGKPQCRIRVEDDSPEGFSDLRSIFTLFRDSKKAFDPTKRGRFELGEKLVIALAIRLQVRTTKGTVTVEGDTRKTSRTKTDAGSVVELTVKMTRAEFAEMEQQFRMVLLSEDDPEVTYNGERLQPREPVTTTGPVVLPTVLSDEEGQLKTTRRSTTVSVHSVGEGEAAYVYEMGIPVVLSGDRYHYNVQQRVPVNWERDNVPPAFLRDVRAAVLDATAHLLDEESARETWVQASLEKAAPEAVTAVLDQQYGKRRVIADPSDPEGTKLAVSRGYTVIPGGAFSRDVWQNIKNSGAALPAGKVTPSPKPYSDDPDATPEELLPPERWTPDMQRVAALTQRLGRELLDTRVDVRFTLSMNGFSAAFGRGSELLLSGATFTYSYRRLGKKWFERANTDEKLLSLIIHEFGHYFSSDHLSHAYHDALCDLGAKLARLALTKPEVFEPEAGL